jgi:thymidylate synthase (FAD)
MSELADEVVGKYFPVLDEGFVALVDYMGGDADVVMAARVSYGAGTKKTNQDRGLLRYLFNHRHSSPLEMVELKFHVKLPIFVARQLVRHRTANINEYSLRYSLAPLQFYLPEYEVFRKQSASNRQGRGESADRAVYDRILNIWKEMYSTAGDVYKEAALIEDVARELARLHLPLSLYTEWYWKIDLHNLFHFLGLRSDSHAQWEIQQYSNMKAAITKFVAPLSFEAWIDYAFCARTFSRLELTALMEFMQTGKMSETRLLELGLTKREAADYIQKTSVVPEIPKFELDLSSAKSADYFRLKAEEAVPKVEKADGQ